MATSSPAPDAGGEKPSEESLLASAESQKASSPAQEAEVIDLTSDDNDDVEKADSTEEIPAQASVKEEENEQPSEMPRVEEDPYDTYNTYNTDFEPDQDVQQAYVEADQPAQAEDDTAAEMLRMLETFDKNYANHQESIEYGADDSAFLPNDDRIVGVESDDEDAHATAFQSIKMRYEAKQANGTADLADDIEFRKADNAEDERKRLRQSRQAYQYQEDINDEQSLFYPENPIDPGPDGDQILDQDDFAEFALPPSERGVPSRASLEAGDDEDESEQESQQKNSPATRGRKRGSNAKGRARGDKVTKTTPRRKQNASKDQRGGRGGKRGGRQTVQLTDTNQLFRNNIIEAATANRRQAQQPGFASKNRKNALTELIASLPEGQRNLHHGDKVDIDKAAKKFNGAGTLKQTAMRADGEGGWKLRGMQTSLKNYQLLGSAFLRERENSKSLPRGGILSDEMGLGKTVMMIANIVDGRPTGSRNGWSRATLIIVPAALTTQWLVEIGKHVEEAVLRKILVHRSGSRIIARNPKSMVEDNDVVITSYHEVLRSLPKNEPPIHLVSHQAKEEWWNKEWEENRGDLHRIKWHRIVLDEAQAIKNHLSRTSEAVCRLQGTYRWAISGTPIQNCVEEFYSYFRFLRCDHTGTFELFKKNFCKRGSPAALQRLQAYLAKIMCRRTHDNQLFGRPILHLPEIKPVETIEVEFNRVERAIYYVVRDRFVSRIRALGSKDTLDRSYRTVFVLLLRLRQLVSSPLLIQKTLKDLLQTEDLERLWEMTRDPNLQSDSDGGAETLRTLQSALETVKPDDPSQNSPRNSLSSSSTSTDDDALSVPQETASSTDQILSFQFRKYLQSLQDDGKWAEANDRSLCHACQRPPVKPCITSCMHLYCHTCLTELQYEAAINDNDQATCLECGLRFRKSEAFAARGFDETVNRRTGGRSKRKGSDEEEEDIDWFTLPGPILQSAKTKGAIKKMKEWWAADPDAKIIVFVQFRALIKIFERICREQGWGYTSFHGGLSFERRDMAVKEFTENEDTKVMLAALKAGGVGLNLVAANRVIIMDLWWNQSVETQAWCRVFRLGQTRNVEIARFVVKDSVDTDILKMQERKTLEVESAMEEKNRPARLTTHELLRLFGPITEDYYDDGGLNGEDESFTFVEDPYEKKDDDVEMVTVPA